MMIIAGRRKPRDLNSRSHNNVMMFIAVAIQWRSLRRGKNLYVTSEMLMLFTISQMTFQRVLTQMCMMLLSFHRLCAFGVPYS